MPESRGYGIAPRSRSIAAIQALVAPPREAYRSRRW
jgi:hypothetical protein